MTERPSIYTLGLKVEFYLTDKPEFWQALANEAARIDDENTGEAQETYSQAEAFYVAFHHDGFDTIKRLIGEVGDHLGWTIEDPSWGGARELGVILTPTGVEDA